MRRDSVYLAHIIEEMEFLQTYFADRSFEEIVQDEMMKRSVLRSLEVIGEASKNLSPVVRARYPDIPWNGMARMAGQTDPRLLQRQVGDRPRCGAA